MNGGILGVGTCCRATPNCTQAPMCRPTCLPPWFPHQPQDWHLCPQIKQLCLQWLWLMGMCRVFFELTGANVASSLLDHLCQNRPFLLPISPRRPWSKGRAAGVEVSGLYM